MRVDDIRQFVSIVDAGSVAGAAQRLGASQPTLSKALARLERALRCTLLERHARGVRLTEAGRVVLGYARNIDIDVRDTLAAVRDLRQGVAGQLRIGAGVGIPHALIAAGCKPLLASGRISLEILGGMSDSLFHAVAAGEADFAVTGVRPPEQARLEWTPLFRDPMIIVAHRSHALAGARSVGWETLAREPWLVSNVGTITRAWFDRQFRERGLAPPERIVGLRGFPHAYELGIAMAALSLLPACTPRWSRDFLDYVEIRRPPDWKSDRVVGILARSGGYIGPAARKAMNSFATAARRMFRDSAPS
jgi:DNA-binding transcriptional LysR family regulator